MGKNNVAENEISVVEETAKKEGLLVRLTRAKDKIMATKAGRVTVRIVKVLTGAAIAKVAYDAGKKSVKPVTVYIENNTPTDESAPAEEPVEETAEEETV